MVGDLKSSLSSFLKICLQISSRINGTAEDSSWYIHFALFFAMFHAGLRAPLSQTKTVHAETETHDSESETRASANQLQHWQYWQLSIEWLNDLKRREGAEENQGIKLWYVSHTDGVSSVFNWKMLLFLFIAEHYLTKMIAWKWNWFQCTIKLLAHHWSDIYQKSLQC